MEQEKLVNNENPVLTCYVTRQSAVSIQCGGLERLFIHFSKPKYFMEYYNENDRDTPFGYISEKEGLYRKHGWESSGKM